MAPLQKHRFLGLRVLRAQLVPQGRHGVGVDRPGGKAGAVALVCAALIVSIGAIKVHLITKLFLAELGTLEDVAELGWADLSAILILLLQLLSSEVRRLQVELEVLLILERLTTKAA